MVDFRKELVRMRTLVSCEIMDCKDKESQLLHKLLAAIDNVYFAGLVAPMTTVFSCTTLPGIIKLGTTYEVSRIVCDDGETRVVWKGYFHD